MASHLREVGSISGIAALRRVLHVNEGHVPTEEDEDFYDEASWAWPSESEGATETSENNEDWFQNALVSISPDGEIICMAKEDRLAVLTGKWERSNGSEGVQRYLPTFDTTAASESDEEITALLTVPLWSHTKSSQSIPDWFCVIVGLSSGFVKFYTAEGDLLLSQFFHEEPVQYLKLSLDSNDLTEELCIVHRSVVVTVDSLGLYQTLRACRSLLAKGKAFSSRDLSFEPPPLAYKKFGLLDQNKMNDCHLLGTIVPNTFDHLKTASVAGGFHARYSSAPPVSTAFLSVGSQPYSAWHYAIEGSAKLLLTDVAYALASRVKSTLLTAASGWLSWAGAIRGSRGDSETSKAKESLKSEPFAPVYPRFGMSDASRTAFSVTVCPMQRLAAVSDSLGRVSLIDVYKGVIVRMWKGYREAQCGWIEAHEDTSEDLLGDSKPHRRTALFLVVLMAKRGVVEIWTAQQGPRVAAFNVVKGTRLLYTTFKGRPGDAGSGSVRSSCWLLYPNGKLDRVVVPFHCSLRGDSSKKARDLHLLQKLRNSIRKGELNNNLDVLFEMRCAGVISQALDLVTDGNDIDATELIRCLDGLILQYDSAEALDAESRLLLCRCRLLVRLARFYAAVKEYEGLPPDYASVVQSDENTEEQISSLLQLTPQELSRLCKPSSRSRGTLTKQASLNLGGFLQVFDLSSCHGNVEEIHLKNQLGSESQVSLATFIFGPVFERDFQTTEKFCELLRESLVHPEHLATLLINYGVRHLGSVPISQIRHIYKLLSEICKLAGLGSGAVESSNGGETLWWQNIRSQISKTTNIEGAYCTALACRSATLHLDKLKASLEKDQSKSVERENAMEDSFGEWEEYSADLVQWNVVLKQLEDLLSLHDLISFEPVRLKISQSERFGSYVDHKLQPDDLSFSLSSVVERGRGSVSELIARWLTQNLLDVDMLSPQPDETSVSSQEHIAETAVEASRHSAEASAEQAHIQGLFSEVRTCLPHSTERDVLLLNVSLEYAALWSKNLKTFAFIEKSLESALAVRATLLRHGMCRLLWSMSVGPVFQDLATLMDKAGRLPKSTSTRKFPLPSPDLVDPFLSMAIHLLDALISAGMVSETPPLVRYDDLWSNFEGATPVFEVALRQRAVNIDLALLHLQLAHVLRLISALAIRGIHAFALFEQSVGRFALFQELHSHPLMPSQSVDPLVSSNRMQFLSLVIAKAVEMLDDSQAKAMDYIGRAMKLGYEWNADVDSLRIRYVTLLYAKGKDSIASEMLPSVENREKVATGLLQLCGSRLQRLFKPEHCSSLSPAAVTWLNECPPKEPLFAEPSLEETKRLLLEILYRLNPSSKEYSLASELQTFVSALDASC